jgi:hypothetical protein
VKVADNLEYSTVVPERLTWAQVKEGVNRLRLKGYKPFPDGYFRLYLDQQGVWDLVHDADFKMMTGLVTSGVFSKDDVLIILYENSFLLDPWIPSYLLVTRNCSAELIGAKTGA